MTDRQRLVYDLSLQCALYNLLKREKTIADDIALRNEMLKQFSGFVNSYSAMLPDSLDAALNDLQGE